MSLKFWGPRFVTGIHLMKQFAHDWYLPWYRYTEACYRVSFIQNNIYTPVSGLSSSVENRSCPESTRCCSQCVIRLSLCQSVLTDGLWPSGYDTAYTSEWRGLSLRSCGPQFATGIHLMKQLARDWYLPYWQCTDACYPVSFIQNDTYIYKTCKYTSNPDYTA